MRKFVFVLLLLVAAAAVGTFVYARRAPGPPIQILQPAKFVGAATTVEVAVGSAEARAGTVDVFFEQNGARTLLAHYDAATAAPVAGAPAAPAPVDQVSLTPTIDRQHVPALASGPARIVVNASRRVLPLPWLPPAESLAERDVQVRLEKPQVSVVSTKHYINLGGSEMIVYRVSPNDVASGVQVGDLEYPGYPAAGAAVDGVAIADPSLRVAFFALRYDQALDTPMSLYARDEAGNEAHAEFDHRTFPKPFKQSRIMLDDTFMNRVVPAILAQTTAIAPTGSLIDKYVAINRDLRKVNNAKIASFAAETSPDMLWKGVPFRAYANSKVEAAFADFRTYVYQGRDVDKEVHLGFDLASFAHTPVLAANRGKVVWAADLGIYGNCVVIDHGMGVQSLYGHLSSIDVKPGQMVDKDQPLGRSGETGLAGGDHLHFTMLVAGQMVNPIEWWDPHWIQDRIVRKLQQAR